MKGPALEASKLNNICIVLVMVTMFECCNSRLKMSGRW
jgi:hypothetical protein